MTKQKSKNESPEALLRRVFPPMLATLAEEPPKNESGWVYELKYDGFRAVTALSGGKLAMWSRNQIDLAGRFPRIAEAVSKLNENEIILDGEIVALDEQGRPRFQLLQQSKHEMIFVFDILWLGGEDLRQRPYGERRKILEKVLKRPPEGVRIAARLDGPGAAALKRAKDSGWEGIIAKRLASVYESRRSKEWLKIKVQNEQEFVVAGWNPSAHSSKEIGSLHLAVNDGGELRYAGKVGTGFSYKQRVWWKDELSKDVVPKPLVKDAPRERVATWVKPCYVVQVSFTEWTEDNRLRHPSFLGIRDDKGVDEVVRERGVSTASDEGPSKTASGERRAASGKAARADAGQADSNVKQTEKKVATKPAKAATAATKSAKSASPARRSPQTAPPAELTLTHPERVLYPRDKITKQDVADYYAAMAEPMIRALRDRPLTLEHWNQGIDAPSWFHQNLGKEAPPWLTTVDTPTRASSRTTVRHLIVDSPQALRWLAQMSVLTVHMWSSRAPALEQPDWIVFDLDPAKGKGIEQAIEAAIIVRRLLDHLELPSVPKTSGKRGIHVFVPLAPGYSHDEANAFACSLGGGLAREIPWLTLDRPLDQRRGRLYLDCMQNAYGKTVVAPYSLRGIDGAPVSAPLKWEEVNKKLDPARFNLRTMPNRLAKVGDLFAAVFEKRVRLPELT